MWRSYQLGIACLWVQGIRSEVGLPVLIYGQTPSPTACRHQDALWHIALSYWIDAYLAILLINHFCGQYHFTLK